MKFRTLIKSCMRIKKINQSDLGDMTGQPQSNVSRTLRADDIKLSVMENYLDAMGYDMEIRAIDRETGACIVVDNRAVQRQTQDQDNKPV